MSITITELARRAGVSVATVSQALNGKGRVNAKTREMVLALAQEFGYRAHTHASGLRSGQSRTIGLQIARSGPGALVPNSTYFTHLLNGAASEAIKQGWLLLALPSDISPQSFEDLGIATAIIVDPALNEPLLTYVAGRGGVVVTNGRIGDHYQSEFPEATFGVVDHDVSAIVNMGLEHAKSAGYEYPALLTARSEASYVLDTVEAFEKWYAKNERPRIIGQFARGNATSAQRVATDLLSGSNKPDLIYTTNEEGVFGALQAARTLNLKIPDDLGVIATMETQILANLHPAVTTIDLKPDAIGKRAVELAIHLAVKSPSPPPSGCVDFEIKPRESTARAFVNVSGWPRRS